MADSLAARVLSATRTRGHEAAVLVLTALTIGLWEGRGYWTRDRFYYLLWNLALAWIPWLLGLAAARARARWVFAVLLVPWLLFLPNAPYVVTDLLHVQARPPVPVWYDSLLFGLLAVTGCALGWTSLARIRARLVREVGVVGAELAVGCVALLTGFGVYLGRFERWNTWDVVHRPAALAQGLREAVNPRAALFSLVFGLLIWAGGLMVDRRVDRAAGPASPP